MAETEIIQEETLEQKVERLEAELVSAKKANAYLQKENDEFKNGSAKMYYALERKNSEMAKMLNSVKLDEIDIASKSDSSFERTMKVMEKAEVIANASKAFGIFAGVTGDENIDINKPIKRPMTAESVADSIGNVAGSQKK
jgi:hypothetical protein